jgi:hypothetical protein
MAATVVVTVVAGAQGGAFAKTPKGTSASAQKLAKELKSLETTVKKEEHGNFKAVYTYKANGGSPQTITFEQAPPKSVFISTGSTGSTKVIDNGTVVDLCSSSSSCEQVSAAEDPLASLIDVFSPTTTLSEFGQAQAEVDAKLAGFNASFSSQTFAGLASTCLNLSGTVSSKTCVAKIGILTYSGTGTESFSLTGYSKSPPASDFALPSGATVMTLPTGITLPSGMTLPS